MAKDKKKIVAEAYAPGADKEAVAKKHKITLQTLYNYKSELNGKSTSKKKVATNGHRKNTDLKDWLKQERARLQEQIAAIDALLRTYTD